MEASSANNKDSTNAITWWVLGHSSSLRWPERYYHETI